MSGKLFEGKTVDDALTLAASEFGVGQDELAHEIVEEKSDDFWGLGDKIYVVRAWVAGAVEAVEEAAPVEEAPAAEQATAEEPEPAAEQAEGEEPASETAKEPSIEPSTEAEGEPAQVWEPAEEAAEKAPSDEIPPEIVPPAEISDTDDLADLTVGLLERIFHHMDFDCGAQARIDGDTLQVAISGADIEYLLDGRGRGLSALELILNHGFRHRTDKDRLKIRVDAGDFRSQRDDELRDIAFQVAHQAKETGSEQLTKPLNPYERRIIHLTLADDDSVTTRSQGSGFLKAVAVIPERRR
jgi:spoIIIJ-associated protein